MLRVEEAYRVELLVRGAFLGRAAYAAIDRLKDQAGFPHSPGFGCRNQTDAVQYLSRWDGALELPCSAVVWANKGAAKSIGSSDGIEGSTFAC